MPTQSKGYFIAPSGDIIPIMDTHIRTVLDNPKKFRTTKKELHEIYDNHKEPYGLEGKARDEILANLVKEGWVRLRYQPRNDYFTAQIYSLTKRIKNWLYGFAQEAMKGIKGDKYTPHTEIAIMNLQGHILDRFSLKEISQDILFKHASVQRVIDISEYENIVSKVIAKLNSSTK